MSINEVSPTRPVAILRIATVTKLRGRSRSAHYADIKEGLFPRPVSIGARAVGHPENEVAAMNAAIIAGKPEAEIRELVRKIEAARTTVA